MGQLDREILFPPGGLASRDHGEKGAKETQKEETVAGMHRRSLVQRGELRAAEFRGLRLRRRRPQKGAEKTKEIGENRREKRKKGEEKTRKAGRKIGKTESGRRGSSGDGDDRRKKEAKK